MNKTAKIILLITGSVIVVGGIGYFIYQKNAKKKQSKSANNESFEVDIEDEDSYISDSELKDMLVKDCKGNGKAKMALNKGLIVRPEWRKFSQHDDISDCKILEWMYEIKYNSDWGSGYSGEELFDHAVFQAHKNR